MSNIWCFQLLIWLDLLLSFVLENFAKDFFSQCLNIFSDKWLIEIVIQKQLLALTIFFQAIILPLTNSEFWSNHKISYFKL